jgi:hypothetical protein
MDVAITGVPDSSASLAFLRGSHHRGQILLALGLLLQPRQRLVDGLQVGQDHLGLDRGDVVGRGHLALHVRHVVVAEHPGDLTDRVGLPDVREELVAQPLALRGAAHDAGDVHELHGRRDRLGGLEHRGEHRQPGVRHTDHADVRLDGGERVVRGEHVVLGQRVEEGRLAGVRQTDDSDGEGHGRPLYVGARGRLKSDRPR